MFDHAIFIEERDDMPPFESLGLCFVRISLGLACAQEQEWALRELDDFFGGRAEDERVPAAEAVGRDYDEVDLLSLYHPYDDAGRVVAVFDEITHSDSPGLEIRFVGGKAAFGSLVRVIEELDFREKIGHGAGYKYRDDVHQNQLGMIMAGEIRRHLQRGERRGAEIHGDEDPGGNKA